ncbi:hypothetical protein [Mesorhizobium sp.]|uniref:hypothetical protein n=2 Tax=Mesorhizobium sp. TaxID=1871066 RepID=UPI00263368FA|nr:hypothetical protein [Mesorhizobium sp.]
MFENHDHPYAQLLKKPKEHSQRISCSKRCMRVTLQQCRNAEIENHKESVMAGIEKRFASTLASGAIIVVLAMPANAQSVGVGGLGGVSVGGNSADTNAGGPNGADGNASFGGSGTSASVSIGGTSGADGNAAIGGSASTATASIGGTNGAGAGATLGNGANSALNVTVGGASGVGAGVGGIAPGTLGATPPGTPNVSSAVAQLSSSQLARMKKRCVDVLSSEGTYDRDLKALCLMISRR